MVLERNPSAETIFSLPSVEDNNLMQSTATSLEPHHGSSNDSSSSLAPDAANYIKDGNDHLSTWLLQQVDDSASMRQQRYQDLSFSRTCWLCWVTAMTFFLPIKWLAGSRNGSLQPVEKIQAFREKMAWVNQTILFYLLVVLCFLVYPSSGCSTVTVEVLVSQGLVSASQQLLNNSLLCQLSTFINFVAGLAMFLIVFLAILSGIHSTLKLSYIYKQDPSVLDAPLVMHIPCYSEGAKDLLKTINSCSETDFEDSKKLLFVVCDGIVTGKGNEKSTADILIDDIFDCRSQKPIPQNYTSTDIGSKQINQAKCFCGFYQVNGHKVAYVLIVKVGNAAEASSPKPGNRGKRDSQLVIYRFFHQVIFSDQKVSQWGDDLFKDIAQKMVSLVRKDPSSYEYLLVADADTFIYPNGIRELVSFLEHSPSYFGVCGETKIGNRTSSFAAFTQAFEYFITHAILKAMENLCSDVLVLSGCYSVYRFRQYKKDGLVVPAILDPRIIKDYLGHHEKNLHQHNLLTIGEDRFLTVLALKYLPRMRNRYIPRAKCHTNAPVNLSTLLCQRRRWTNSLVHCHIYLLQRIFNLPIRRIPAIAMVMLLELYYIFVLPLMIPYSVVAMLFGFSTFNTCFVLAFTIGIPLVLCIITGRGKMILYAIGFILWTPVYSCLIPLYSVWKMDDFGWGSTRAVEGDEELVSHN